MQKQLSFDLVCFSNSRWDYLFDRPHHLMVCAANERRVFFVEEPQFGAEKDTIEENKNETGVIVITPKLKGEAGDEVDTTERMSALTSQIFERVDTQYVLWFYSLSATRWTQALKPMAVVYDCISEPSSLHDEQLSALEHELLGRASVVFTGGQSLYESKFSQHPNVYPFPNRVSIADFLQARSEHEDAAEQKEIPHPRLGFVGKIDARLDFGLVAKVAAEKPEWHQIFVGPIEIDEDMLPRAENIHYLGPKEYSALPQIISGWDVAMIPFAENELTRFLNPKKTSEYLASGVPVVSTAIPDVVRPYSLKGLLRVADSPDRFIESCQTSLDSGAPVTQEDIDNFLQKASWDDTWHKMSCLLKENIRTAAVEQLDLKSAEDLKTLGTRTASNT